jgi:hypothetical protein
MTLNCKTLPPPKARIIEKNSSNRNRNDYPE